MMVGMRGRHDKRKDPRKGSRGDDPGASYWSDSYFRLRLLLPVPVCVYYAFPPSSRAHVCVVDA